MQSTKLLTILLTDFELLPYERGIFFKPFSIFTRIYIKKLLDNVVLHVCRSTLLFFLYYTFRGQT